MSLAPQPALRFVGGRLALDFANIVPANAELSWWQLIAFLEAARIVTPERGGELLALSRSNRQPAQSSRLCSQACFSPPCQTLRRPRCCIRRSRDVPGFLSLRPRVVGVSKDQPVGHRRMRVQPESNKRRRIRIRQIQFAKSLKGVRGDLGRIRNEAMENL